MVPFEQDDAHFSGIRLRYYFVILAMTNYYPGI